MNKLQLQKFANSLDGENITFHLQTDFGKWYEQKFTSDFENIEVEKSYGACVDGSVIDFIFKTGKKYDNILKTFVTQYINKYAVKNSNGWDDKNCCISYPDKKEVLNKLKNNDRISKHYFYTTLYGIGYFCYLMSQKAHNEAKKVLSDYLLTQKIDYKNEFSEAGWVYRFVINKDVKIHNELLTNFNI